MSVKQSLNVLEQQRVDTTDLKSIDSSIIFDFKTLIQSFQVNEPYILKGFKIPVANIAGPASSLQMEVSGGVVWIPNDPAGPFLRVETGTPNEVLTTSNAKVIGSFSPGVNFVGLQFNRATDPTTNDLVSLWDVDSAVEFTKTAPRGLVMSYQIVISSSGFGDTAPVAKVTVVGSNVTQIENCKKNMFRLGRGGSSPDVNYEFNFSVDPENSLIATSNSDPDPFDGGDWQLGSFKDWMDRVMTEIKRMKGTAYWYVSGSAAPMSGLSLLHLYQDALGTVITSKGSFTHSISTPGLLTWSANLHLKSIISNRMYTITAGNVTLSDNQVAYISLVRDNDFQPLNIFTFAAGSPTVTGTLPVSALVAGDYIKAISHPETAWRQVLSVVGNTITLTTNYPISAIQKGLKSSGGPYTVTVANPESVPPSGDTFWIAKRADEASASATVNNVQRVSDLNTLTTTVAHGFVVGQSILVSGLADTSFNGRFEVFSVPTGSSLTYKHVGIDVSSTPDSGTITSPAKIYLRLGGGDELDQGESRQVDDNTTQNILEFIGSDGEADTTPPYSILPNGLSPFVFSTNDSLTKAISQITGNTNAILTALDQPSYDESTFFAAPVISGSTLTIPVNTRLGGSPQQFYVVGKGTLEVFLNGQYLELGATNGWTEVGASLSNSDQIIINQALVAGDTLTFRLDATGGPGSGGAGSPFDINALPISNTADNADYIPIYDVSVPGQRKQLRSVFLSGLSNLKQIATYSANHLADVNTDDVILVNASGAPRTITLPTAASSTGKVFDIKKIDSSANAVLILPNGADVIDGMASLSTTTQYASFTIVSDGVSWWIL